MEAAASTFFMASVPPVVGWQQAHSKFFPEKMGHLIISCREIITQKRNKSAGHLAPSSFPPHSRQKTEPPATVKLLVVPRPEPRWVSETSSASHQRQVLGRPRAFVFQGRDASR